MNVFIASDHGGFTLKKKLLPFVEKQGYHVSDLGPYTFKGGDDYPDFALPLAEKVRKSKNTIGIIICRNGQGVCIAANKVKGIRAVTGFSMSEAKTTRQDDHANVLCLPADYLSENVAKKIVLTWLKTPFSHASRHLRRLQKIQRYEQQR